MICRVTTFVGISRYLCHFWFPVEPCGSPTLGSISHETLAARLLLLLWVQRTQLLQLLSWLYQHAVQTRYLSLHNWKSVTVLWGPPQRYNSHGLGLLILCMREVHVHGDGSGSGLEVFAALEKFLSTGFSCLLQKPKFISLLLLLQCSTCSWVCGWLVNFVSNRRLRA